MISPATTNAIVVVVVVVVAAAAVTNGEGTTGDPAALANVSDRADDPAQILIHFQPISFERSVKCLDDTIILSLGFKKKIRRGKRRRATVIQ